MWPQRVGGSVHGELCMHHHCQQYQPSVVKQDVEPFTSHTMFLMCFLLRMASLPPQLD